MLDKRFLTPQEMRGFCIETGHKKCGLRVSRTLVLAIMAGAFIALGAAGANMAIHSLPATLTGLKKVLAGAIFPVGLMMIVIAGGELFTGNCLISAAALEKRVSWAKMGQNLVIVYLGNFIGAFLIAWMLYQSGLFDTSQGMLGETHVKIALEKVSLTFGQAFIRGILCNILVAIAVYMSYAATSIVDKIWAMWFPVMLFIVGGYEHCIANMYYIPAGILQAAGTVVGLNWLTFAVNNLLPVTLGNLVGGAVVIGAVYWFAYCPPTAVRQATNNIDSKGQEQC